MATSHYQLIGYVSDALAEAKTLQDLMAAEGKTVTVQIGDDLASPAGETDAPCLVIVSLGADSTNGREPRSHNLQIDACFLSSSSEITTSTANYDANGATGATGPQGPQGQAVWTVNKKVYGSISKADSIIDAIRDAIGAKLDKLAKAQTCFLSLKTVQRESICSFPLVVATATIEIENPNPQRG
jgi:hypothetical protein